MREVQDTTESGSNGSFSGEDRTAEEDTGWETDLSKDFKRPAGHPELIRIANEKLPLSELLKAYKIDFQIVYSPSGWTHKAICPFADHNERNPSFSYNSVEDRFNCFGCGRAGKSVQFKAAMHSLPIMEVAQSIIEQYSSFEEAYSEIKERIEDKSDDYLYGFSSYVRDFLQKRYGDMRAFEFAENLCWSLDVYLQKHLLSPQINNDNLKARIDILKERLDEYK
jgi:hypothetical protein